MNRTLEVDNHIFTQFNEELWRSPFEKGKMYLLNKSIYEQEYGITREYQNYICFEIEHYDIKKIDISIIKAVITEYDNLISSIDIQARESLELLSNNIWGKSKYKMMFDGFIIDNQLKSLFFDFGMIYSPFNGKDNDFYSNWIVFIKDFKIVGFRRRQL